MRSHHLNSLFLCIPHTNIRDIKVRGAINAETDNQKLMASISTPKNLLEKYEKTTDTRTEKQFPEWELVKVLLQGMGTFTIMTTTDWMTPPDITVAQDLCSCAIPVSLCHL